MGSCGCLWQISNQGNLFFIQSLNEIIHDRTMNDDFATTFRCRNGVSFIPERLQVEWDWKDQGWGNQKGRLRLDLLRIDGNRQLDVVASVELDRGQVAAHEWEHREVSIEGDDPLLASIQEGDTFRVQSVVGGGGGHELFVANFRLGLMSANCILK